MAYVIERESRTGSRYVGIYRAADGTYKSAGTYDLRRLRDCQIIERIRTAAPTSSPPTACLPPCSSPA